MEFFMLNAVRFFIVTLAVSITTLAVAADVKSHRVSIQVDQNDPQVMNLALNNATNVIEYFRGKNEDVEVDIVTYGPGLHMLRADTSPVQDRIKRLKELAFPGKIQFSACNNTKQGMEKAEGHAISVLPDATIVPSGVVRLMELQEQGWSYVRP
jgi:intracellular sulfur oxidation DsrE/DsrF family protein